MKSLCVGIPTFNRASKIDLCLQNLVKLSESYQDQLSIVVVDNGSTDSTHEVLEKWKIKCNYLLCFRNERNIGPALNVLKVMLTATNADFLWIIGDDDFITAEGLRLVLENISKKDCPNFLFLNSISIPSYVGHLLSLPVLSLSKVQPNSRKSQQIESLSCIEWKKLVNPHFDDVYMGSLMCSVFRVSLVRDVALVKFEEIVSLSCDDYSSLLNTYPHAVVFAEVFSKQVVSYISTPCVLTQFGHHEWAGYLPLIKAVHLRDLLDFYKNKISYDTKDLKAARRHLLESSAPSLAALFFGEAKGRKFFSFPLFLLKNLEFPFLLILVLLYSVVEALKIRHKKKALLSS